MKHWHGVALALFLGLICLVVELTPATLINKDPALFGLFCVLVATLAETIWLIAMDPIETRNARVETSAANEKTQQALPGIQKGYGELFRSIGVRMEHNGSLVGILDGIRTEFIQMEAVATQLSH